MTETRKITSLLIPMQQKPLLVPVACVVDIVGYTRPSGNDTPGSHWFLGDINWRGETVPLISFERMNQRRFAEFSATARLAVFNTISETPGLPFYAMVIQGVPQSIELQPADILNRKAETGVAEKMQVTVNQLPSCIPDLQLIEECLGDHLREITTQSILTLHHSREGRNLPR